MAKIYFVMCTLAALVVIASSKSLSHQEETCYDCTDAIGAGEVHKRQKRDRNAPEVINSVTGLLQGILVPTWNGIVKVNRDKMNARKPGPFIIGPGRGNQNRVMFNFNNDDYDDGYSGRNYNYNRNQRNDYY